MKYQVNESLCAGCRLCVDVCPVKAITISDIAKIDVDLCTGCGACVNVCRKGAIVEVPVETVKENLPVPVAITSGIANAIGSIGSTIKRYTNSSAQTGSRQGSTGRGGGRGRGGGGRRNNKKNKRR
ncbi:MAG: DUF362 domain-containing protein [Methanosarcinales archaeon]